MANFKELKVKAEGAQEEALKWYKLTETYDTEVNNAREVFMATVKDMFEEDKFDFDSAWDMKDLLQDTLTELITASDVLLKECQTKMDENNGMIPEGYKDVVKK